MRDPAGFRPLNPRLLFLAGRLGAARRVAVADIAISQEQNG